MVLVTNPHIPSFVSFPVNNDRTAWRPFGLPILLLETDRRDLSGRPLDNSGVLSIRIVIEDVPHKAIVAGQDHIGLMFPDHEIFARTLSLAELMYRSIALEAQVFFRADGTEIDYSEAVAGDLMQYTTASGVRDTVTYYPTANYYDLSDITIETEELPPDYYYLSYQAEYYARVESTSTPGQLNCIDVTRTALSVYRFRLNHPGQVMEETTRLTPAPYMTSDKRSQDTTIAFYRPFTDVLQDIFDEQALLGSINWVDRITPEFVPYLSYLLGLDVPYFPHSLDQLRRTMLRNIVRLQQLKGSRRAIIDLFELFGFIVYLNDLYWSKNGERLIRPGQSLPAQFSDQEINIVQRCQIEPVLVAYNTDGYGKLTIPLLYRPTKVETTEGIASVVEGGDVVLDAYLVEDGSDAQTQLETIVSTCNSLSDYGESVGCELPTVTGNGIIGYSQVVIGSLASVGTDEMLAGGQPPFLMGGVTLDRGSNLLRLTFNGAILFKDDYGSHNPLKLYAFATYNRQDLIIPDAIKDLHSNRFDIQLLTRDGEQITSDVLEFLVDYLFGIKAFHSLLNTIIYHCALHDTYQVTDICLGGDLEQRSDTDAGKLQVPPAIIPIVPEGDCYVDPGDLGYKPEDIALRKKILADLPEEFDTWKALDGRDVAQIGSERLAPTPPSGTECQFNKRGQDRSILTDRVEETNIEYGPSPFSGSSSVASESNLAESPVEAGSHGEFEATGAGVSSNNDSSEYGPIVNEQSAVSDTWCGLNGIADYCYKGRVNDGLLHRMTQLNVEQYQAIICQLNFGYGIYYVFPATSKLTDSKQGSALKQSYQTPLVQNNFLGRLLRGYDTVDWENIHFTDRPYLTENALGESNLLALQRPSLGIGMPLMHFPGTRFATLNKLVSDFTHPKWMAKPWDDEYSSVCGPFDQPCRKPTYLNAKLVENLDGDLVLDFDETPFTIISNGLAPDIPNFGSHDLDTGWKFTTDDVIHAIYSAEADGHIAIELDSVILAPAELIDISEPLYNSAVICGDHYTDFEDGYPALTGYQPYVASDFDRGAYTELFDALDIDRTMPTGTEVLFYFISGIAYRTGYRFGCGCAVSACDTGETAGQVIALDCSLGFYELDNGYDYNPDRVESDICLVAEEPIGVKDYRFNGQISNMFELE